MMHDAPSSSSIPLIPPPPTPCFRASDRTPSARTQPVSELLSCAWSDGWLPLVCGGGGRAMVDGRPDGDMVMGLGGARPTPVGAFCQKLGHDHPFFLAWMDPDAVAAIDAGA